MAVVATRVPIVMPASPNRHSGIAKAAARASKLPSPSKSSSAKFSVVIESFKGKWTHVVLADVPKDEAKTLMKQLRFQAFSQWVKPAWVASKKDPLAFVTKFIPKAEARPDAIGKLCLAWLTDIHKMFASKAADHHFQFCAAIEAGANQEDVENVRIEPSLKKNVIASSSSSIVSAGGGGERHCSHCKKAGHYKPKCPELNPHLKGVAAAARKPKKPARDDEDFDEDLPSDDEITESDEEDFKDFSGGDGLYEDSSDDEDAAEDDAEDDDAEDDDAEDDE
jgi:hypothetical protein